MTLYKLLRSKQEETLNRWMAEVRGTLAPQLMAPLELVDHFPRFLKEIVWALATADGLDAQGEVPEESDTASDHGEQRLRLGFSLDAVIREYGALRNAIVQTARAHDVEIT